MRVWSHAHECEFHTTIDGAQQNGGGVGRGGGPGGEGKKGGGGDVYIYVDSESGTLTKGSCTHTYIHSKGDRDGRKGD